MQKRINVEIYWGLNLFHSVFTLPKLNWSQTWAQKLKCISLEKDPFHLARSKVQNLDNMLTYAEQHCHVIIKNSINQPLNTKKHIKAGLNKSLKRIKLMVFSNFVRQRCEWDGEMLLNLQSIMMSFVGNRLPSLLPLLSLCVDGKYVFVLTQMR